MRAGGLWDSSPAPAVLTQLAMAARPVEAAQLLNEADVLILWSIRPSGFQVPVEDVREALRQWRMRFATLLTDVGVRPYA